MRLIRPPDFSCTDTRARIQIQRRGCARLEARPDDVVRYGARARPTYGRERFFVYESSKVKMLVKFDICVKRFIRKTVEAVE